MFSLLSLSTLVGNLWGFSSLEVPELTIGQERPVGGSEAPWMCQGKGVCLMPLSSEGSERSCGGSGLQTCLDSGLCVCWGGFPLRGGLLHLGELPGRETISRGSCSSLRLRHYLPKLWRMGTWFCVPDDCDERGQDLHQVPKGQPVQGAGGRWHLTARHMGLMDRKVTPEKLGHHQ